MSPGSVLLLNADYTPIQVIDWRRGVSLFLKEVVTAASDTYYSIRSQFTELKLPTVLALKKYVKYKKGVSYSRRKLFVRDNYICAYCGDKLKLDDATVDHVVPRSKGGATRWENLVTACIPCNSKKGNRTPDEAKMPLLYRARRPKVYFTEKRKEWKPYIKNAH